MAKNKKNSTNSSVKKSPIEFIANIMDSLFGNNDPEVEKKRLLRNVAKEISKSKFKYYKVASCEILPSFGRLFYDIYKVMYQAQLLFNAIQNPNALKSMVVDACLSDYQRTLMDDISEERINELAGKMKISELSAKIKDSIDKLKSSFDLDKIHEVDDVYTRLLAIKNFATFDYYFMVKKLNPGIREGDFSVTPHFGNSSGEHIVENLKDFLVVAWALPLDDNWNKTCEVLKSIKQLDVLPVGIWKKVVSKLRAIRVSKIFDYMVQHLTKDPFYQTKVSTSTQNIIDDYIEKTVKNAEQAVNKLKTEQKNTRSGNLISEIFGSADIIRLQNYTEQGSSFFEKKKLGSYLYWQPLNCLKAFLIDVVKREVREYADLVLVRATWTTAQLATPMSDAYHNLLDASDKISKFDARIAENGDLGIKIKNYLPRAEREKDARNIIHTALNDINGYAKEFIVDGYKNLVSFARTTKMLLEDQNKTSENIVINWKEVERFAEHDVRQMGVDVYKKIYSFAQLMQTFLSN